MSNSSSNLYRPPYARNLSWSSSLNKRTNRKNQNQDVTNTIDFGNDSFPELVSNPSQKQPLKKQENEAASFLETIESATSDTVSNERSMPTVQDGWIEITKDTYKNKTCELRKNNIELLQARKDPFIYRMLHRDRYVQSLNDEQYKNLANEKMDEVVRVYRRQASEFISIYGYDYYDHIYGYKPVYNKRVLRPYITNELEENVDCYDIENLYSEYYSDDEEYLYNDDIDEYYDYEDIEEY